MGQSTQAVFTIAGSFFGPWGTVAGSIIGGMLQPNAKAEGSRLDDLRAPAFQYGGPIPRIRGRYRTAGGYIWASAKRELATVTEQGKGGPSTDVTSYTYEIDVFLILSDGPIESVSRVWMNGELVYAAIDGASDATLAASADAELWTAMRVYTGAATQLPDPTYEDAVGAGNAPAYRGRGTVFIEGLQLGSSGQLPSLSFEVFTESAFGMGTPTERTTVPTEVAFNIGTAAPGDTTIRVPFGQWDAGYATTEVKVYDIDVLDGAVDQVGSYNVSSATPGVATGNSDVTVLHMSAGTDGKSYVGADGDATLFTYPENLGGEQVRFSRTGSTVIFGSSLFGLKKLHRFNTIGGSAVVSSAAMTDYVNSILIIGETVYAASKNTKQVFVLDVATLTLQTTINRPSFSTGDADPWPQLVNLGDELCLIQSDTSYKVFVYRNAAWVQIGNLNSTLVAGSDLHPTTFVLGGRLMVGGKAVTGGAEYLTWSAPLTNEATPLDLADEVTELCAQAGLSAADIDVTELSGTEVIGYAVTQVSPIRSILQTLSTAFYFECVESDKLYFRTRGGSSAASIPFDMLGARVNDADRDDPLGIQRANDLEIPARVSLSYINLSQDYETGSVDSDRLVGVGNDVVSLQMPIVMEPPKAKGIAQTAALDGRVAGTTFKPAISFLTDPRLEPTDVVTLIDEDATTYRARLVRETYADGVRSFDAVLDDATVLIDAGITFDSYEPVITVLPPADSTLELLDIPLLRDADDGPGIYAAVKSAGGKWPGASVLRSQDDLTFTSDGTLSRQATIGVAALALGTFSGGAAVFDEVNSISVDVGDGTLASYTRDEILNGTAVAYLLGAEVFYARTATLTAPGVYTLSGLLRGRKGTEWAISTHAAGELFVVLSDNGLLHVDFDAALVGSTQYYKAVTNGRPTGSAISEAFADEGVALMPYAPVDLRGARSTNGDMAMTWKRRTRLSSTFTGPLGSVVPLGETSESYQVAIWNSTFTTLKRTITVSAAAATYTAEQQVTDFGSIQSSIYVRVHQVSATVGAGYALQGTLTQTFASYFSPATMNDRKATVIGAGASAVVQREGSTGGAAGAIGLYSFTVGDAEPSFAAVYAGSATAPYLPGLSLSASDPATGHVVIFLRNQGNAQAYRRLLYGNPDALSQVVPAFMPLDPPAAVQFMVDKFVEITRSREVWHSSDGGATWTDMGAMYGGPAIDSAAASFQGVYLRVVDGVLVLRYQNQVFYNAALDGIDWVAATGDIASLPTGTYTGGLTLYALEASDTGDAGVIIGHARDATNTLFGLVYTSTDGMAWTLAYEDEIAGPAWGIKSGGFNAGLIFFDGDFLCDLWPLVPGSDENTVLPIDTVGSHDITFNRKAAAGVPTDTGVATVYDGISLYDSTDAVVFDLVDWE